jgi:hypothetical protein
MRHDIGEKRTRHRGGIDGAISSAHASGQNDNAAITAMRDGGHPDMCAM